MKSTSLLQAKLTLIVSAIALIIMCAWAYWAEIDQLARAQGQVIASSRTQVIQSSIDGVIESFLVSEGQKVEKGQVLVQLERTQADAAYNDSLAKVAALKANLDRLQAEVFGRDLMFSPEVMAYPTFKANQTELFNRRQEGLKAELAALEKTRVLIQKELTLTEPLLEMGDVGQVEIIRLQRQVAEIEGKITNRSNDYFQDAQTEMTKAEENLAVQEQVLADRAQRLERTQLKASSDGFVRKIFITTPGANVKPGEIVMELLPTDSKLIVEAKLKPSDIAVTQVGMPATVKLDAFDYSIYGSLFGTVSYISPDALKEKTNLGDQFYYLVQIEVTTPDEDVTNPISIQPGMTCLVEIITGTQTVMKYITKPITKTLHEAVTER